MSFFEILFTILVRPLMLLFEVIYIETNRIINNPGVSIIALSLAMNFLVLPLYRRADAIQEEERDTENKLRDGIAHIKKTFKGDERMMILQAYYRQNDYKPTDVFKGSISLFLEIPFFIAAYQFLSHLEMLNGVSFGMIRDLGAADALLNIAGHSVNVLPMLMTGINLISCVIFTKGYPLKTKIQLYFMAIFFFFFLYASPAGLVFYWTLNNLFSLVKTIFYKIRNPRRVLSVIAAVLGAASFVFGVFVYQGVHHKLKFALAAVGLVLLMPLLLEVLQSKNRKTFSLPSFSGNKKLFWTGAFYLTMLLGGNIASAVIASSPQEFVDMYQYMNPNWYIISSLCYAVGLFLVWMGIFYWLAGEKYRGLFDLGIWAAAVVASVNYLVFGKNKIMLDRYLRYEDVFVIDKKVQLINAAVVLLCVVAAILLYRFGKKWLPQLILLASLSLGVMTVYNMVNINTAVDGVREQSEAFSNSAKPEFNLSKTGKNVVIVMLDRAQGAYIPYLINENPELKEIYSGFTYYSNTISFGGCTNVAMPAMIGGYEYTPEEMNKRDDVSMKDKHNEALSVLPVLFSENGYDTTVINPTYANYEMTPDPSIYDEYDGIDGYCIWEKYTDFQSKVLLMAANKRNFFCYSVMKAAPSLLQQNLYNNGFYNSEYREYSLGNQTITSTYTAKDTGLGFMDHYNALGDLKNMVTITEDGSDNFLFMTNDLTHNPMMVQEPEYEPSMSVDNTEYEMANADRYTVDGKTLSMTEQTHYNHYQTNMAALLQFGKWLQYLKDEGVYDNTRIILVSDHGYELYQREDLQLTDVYDLQSFYPLLMVKDFNSTEFTVSDEFMTNADVATLATEKIIENPVNPFTGNAINSDEKLAHDQHIYYTRVWQPKEHNEYTYLRGNWLSVHDNGQEKSNWDFVGENTLLPQD